MREEGILLDLCSDSTLFAARNLFLSNCQLPETCIYLTMQEEHKKNEEEETCLDNRFDAGAVLDEFVVVGDCYCSWYYRTIQYRQRGQKRKRFESMRFLILDS
jgi:hypothetical protein